jgi:hypothetical protein
MANTFNTLLFSVLRNREAEKQRAYDTAMRSGEDTLRLSSEALAQREQANRLEQEEAQKIGGAIQTTGEAPWQGAPELEQEAETGALYERARAERARLSQEANMALTREAAGGKERVAQIQASRPRSVSSYTPYNRETEELLKLTQSPRDSIRNTIAQIAAITKEYDDYALQLPSKRAELAARVGPLQVQLKAYEQELQRVKAVISQRLRLPPGVIDKTLEEAEDQGAPETQGNMPTIDEIDW